MNDCDQCPAPDGRCPAQRPGETPPAPDAPDAPDLPDASGPVDPAAPGTPHPAESPDAGRAARRRAMLPCFASDLVDRVRAGGNVWRLPGGQLRLPRVFGFCRGVTRALALLDEAVARHAGDGKRLFLLGEIIHNPWVNEYFQDRGVRILTPDQRHDLPGVLTAEDVAIIPAFGVVPAMRRNLESIGCEIVDSSCGDVLRLWKWAEHAAAEGYGVLVYGKPTHDETVVTRSRLAEAGGKYLVLNDLEKIDLLCAMIHGRADGRRFAESFGPPVTNASGIEPFLRLAQVSQTTMLYSETQMVRDRVGEAFAERFGPDEAARRLLLQPTVCRATQQRQDAAVELCRSGCDWVVVIGGRGSSNTRHLYELARAYVPAVFIEDERWIEPETFFSYDFAADRKIARPDVLTGGGPLRVGVLAGASTPEIVVGRVLERLAQRLGRRSGENP